MVLADLSEFPAWLDGHLLETRLTALERAAEAAHGRLMVAFSGGADSAFLLAAAVRALGADNVAAATAYSDSLPAGRARPRPGVRRVARRRGAHAADGGDGARGLPRQRRRPVRVLQGRAARRARAAGRGARVRRRRHRDQRRRRAGRLPSGDRRGRGPRSRHAAQGRRPHQGPDPGGVAGVGPADVGQARGGLPELARRLRHRDHPGPPGPRRACRGGAARGPDRRRSPGRQPAGPRPR